MEILYFAKSGYGYELFKTYIELYPKTTMRSIYYHLNKGLQTGEFRIDKITKAKGEYSWGSEAEKKIYALGEKAAPKIDKKARDYFSKKKIKQAT